MSLTRIICEGCGNTLVYCDCEKEKLMIQTVVLEQAKKIEELGVEIDTYLYHQKYEDKWYIVDHTQWDSCYQNISAPTAEEMLDRMPEEFQTGKLHNKSFWYLVIHKEDDLYLIGYDSFVAHDEEDINLHQTQNKSLSVAVGDRFIWCAENNHLEQENAIHKR